jgi:thiosulfate/3-mercaptopyruvate sulfurtransferase
MKTYRIYFSVWLTVLFVLISCTGYSQKTGTEPWKDSQLMASAELAGVINDPGAVKPTIFSIGPGASIRGSIDIGPAKDNLEKLRRELNKLPKDKAIVIYCGCCPFEHCPNIRPAFNMLNEMKYTNHKLLNLPKNLKVDWIDKGYPVKK